MIYTELLPCPFCGGEAEQADLEDEVNFGGSVIQCKKCQASSAVHFDRKEHLYSSWNERPAINGEEVVERVAIACWNEESVRAAGRPRNVLWSDIGVGEREKWLGIARAALAAINEKAGE